MGQTQSASAHAQHVYVNNAVTPIKCGLGLKKDIKVYIMFYSYVTNKQQKTSDIIKSTK